MGLALAAVVTVLVLGIPEDRVSAPPREPIPATVTPRFAESVTMPELWDKDETSAREEMAALGFTAQITRMNPENITDPKQWVVAGQAPGPGQLIRSGVPVILHVVPEEPASRP